MNVRHCGIPKERQGVAVTLFGVILLLCVGIYDMESVRSVLEYVNRVNPKTESFAAGQSFMEVKETYCPLLESDCFQLSTSLFLQRIEDNLFNLTSIRVEWDNNTEIATIILDQEQIGVLNVGLRT